MELAVLPISSLPWLNLNWTSQWRLVRRSVTDGEGTGHLTEFVVEVVIREGGNGRHRGIERVLEGWSTIQEGPCELSGLESLSHLLKKQKVVRGSFFVCSKRY